MARAGRFVLLLVPLFAWPGSAKLVLRALNRTAPLAVAAAVQAAEVAKRQSPGCLGGWASNSTTSFVLKGPTQDAFDDIYQKRLWGGDGHGSSLSGSGSNLESTRTLCGVLAAAVSRTVKEKQAQNVQPLVVSILDAPSGDFFWMPNCLGAVSSQLPQGASLKYQGVDVSSVAKSMAEGRRPQVQGTLQKVAIEPFRVVNLADPGVLSREFPGAGFDILLCHDALQHNPLANVRKIIDNFNAVHGRFLVVDVDRGGSNYQNITAGGMRSIDLTSSPFGFAAECLEHNGDQPSTPWEDEWFGIFRLPLRR